jgi:N-acetylglucosaminyl-diphospho-decaprenol L-rhamnosyltransferase
VRGASCAPPAGAGRAMAVVVAVVSWNTRELLVRCLRSLEPVASDGRAEIWVVDNGSGDGSVSSARACAPWARIIEPGSNLGFGPAVNLVAERSSSAWLLAANADIALQAGALEAMLAAAEDPRVGCVVPRLVLADGRTQQSVHPLPTIPFTLVFNLGLHRLSKRLAAHFCLPEGWDPARERDVPWAIGACMLLRRSAFEQAGGFDPRQWMYAEDLDLCWRLREHGWRTRYQPAATVLHQSGAAAGQAFGEDRRPMYMTETYAMLARRRGRATALATATINVVGAAARVAWTRLLSVRWPRWRAVSADNRAWLRAHVQALRETSTLRGDDR